MNKELIDIISKRVVQLSVVVGVIVCVAFWSNRDVKEVRISNTQERRVVIPQQEVVSRQEDDKHEVEDTPVVFPSMISAWEDCIRKHKVEWWWYPKVACAVCGGTKGPHGDIRPVEYDERWHSMTIGSLRAYKFADDTPSIERILNYYGYKYRSRWIDLLKSISITIVSLGLLIIIVLKLSTIDGSCNT